MSENERYDDLDKSIGRLKRAAIDAYVRDKIGGDADSFTRNKDGYEMVFSGTTMAIVRPGPDGEGGGTGFTASTSNSGPNYGGGSGSTSELDYTKEFNSVRRKSAIVSKLELGLETLKGLANEKEVSQTSGSYDDALASLTKAFTQLNETITTVEKAVEKNLIDNMSEMRKKKSSYDLKLAAAKSSDVSTSERLQHIDQSRVEDTLTRSKPKVVQELNSAWHAIQGTHMTHCVSRPEKIGIGINGPSSKFHGMKWLIHDLIEELTEETEYAFKDFELAVELIQQGDSTSKTKLEEMEQKIKDGSGLRPWQDRSIEKKVSDKKKQEQQKKKQEPGENNQGNSKKK